MNVLRELRKKAEVAWMEHFNKCSDQRIWETLNIGLREMAVIELSWKHRWIEQQLDNLENSSTIEK